MDRIKELQIKLGENDFTLIKYLGRVEQIDMMLKNHKWELEPFMKRENVEGWLNENKIELLNTIKENSENIDY
jgi:hypothetical protein